MIRVLGAALAACLLMSAPAKALAQPPVEDIVKQMREAFTPVRPSTRKIEISMTAEGETIKWVAREAIKRFPDGNRMLLVMLEPQDVKGNAYVISEPKGKGSVIWTYMPALRRVRELTGVEAYEHFLGTDFTYADLGFVRFHPHYRFLGEEEHGGKQTYKIEETVPKERAYYSRVITWVSKDSMLPVQRDYYDVAGALWKTELLEGETIDGVPTPIRIQMKDLQGKSSTEMRVSDVTYDATIPDALFDPMQLPVAANSPVWQSVAQGTMSH
ncbi:MAG: outer membrane lipoprotein-sorting protein [Candidatus Binatia bacterium]